MDLALAKELVICLAIAVGAAFARLWFSDKKFELVWRTFAGSILLSFVTCLALYKIKGLNNYLGLISLCLSIFGKEVALWTIKRAEKDPRSLLSGIKVVVKDGENSESEETSAGRIDNSTTTNVKNGNTESSDPS